MPQRERRTAGLLPNRFGYEEVVLMLNTLEQDHDIPPSYAYAFKKADDNDWLKALKLEMNSLKRSHMWQLIRVPEDRKVRKTKWVFELKRYRKGKELRHKARLVTNGSLTILRVDFKEVLSLVSKYSTVCLLLTPSAQL